MKQAINNEENSVLVTGISHFVVISQHLATSMISDVSSTTYRVSK